VIRRLGKKILLSLGSLLIALGLAEGAMRVLGFRPQLSSEWMLTTPFRVLDDDILTVEREFLTDEFYRSIPAEESPTRVIATIGDSYTMGFPVDPSDAYPKSLDRILRERSQAVTVLNFGMGDTGTDQHLKLFTKYVLPRAKPDIVIWQFCGNDCYDNAIKPLFDISTDDELVPLDVRDNWMFRRQRFLEEFPLPMFFKRNSYLFRLPLRIFETDLEAQVPDGEVPEIWGFRKIPLAVARMNELADQHGFRVYYVIVRPQTFYENPDSERGSTYQGIRTNLVGQPGFVDTTFAPTDPGQDIVSAYFADGARDPNPPGFRHFNEAGYAEFARLIADRLLKDGVLGD